MKYLISYDISSDKRRRKVVKVLEGYGFRVQFSVFECDLNRKQYIELRNRLKPLLATKTTDSIRLYHFCVECQKKVTVFGTDHTKSLGGLILV